MFVSLCQSLWGTGNLSREVVRQDLKEVKVAADPPPTQK